RGYCQVNRSRRGVPTVVHLARTGISEKRIRVQFFRSDSGNESVRDWLLHELDKEQRYAVGEDLRTIEFGWPVGMPRVRKLGESLWESRTTFKNGIARVFFTIERDRMILLHAIVKKSPKTPQQSLQTARQRQ